jgi:HlyD family secretion protein
MNAQAQLRPHVVAPEPQKPSHRRFYGIALLCVALGAGVWAWSIHERTIPIQTVEPVYQDIETSLASTGVVVPVHDFQARANFSGIVEKIYVHVGQNVRAGQMLVQMKDQYATSRLDAARAALQAARLNLANAEQNGTLDERIGFRGDLVRAQSERNSAASELATLKQLAQRGSVSQAEVQAAEQRLKLANAALMELRQRMTHRYSAAQIESLKDKVRADRDSVAAEKISWGNANVSTPIAGTVYIVPVRPYDFVPGGNELMHVADLRHMEVRASFWEPDVAKLHAGEQVTIHWDGDPGKSWSGQVMSAPIAVDRSGPLSVGHCIISLTSPIGNLPVNSSVSVNVQWQKHAHVLTVPRQALHGEGANTFVFRVIGDRLRKTPVTVGLLNAMRAEIAAGLNARNVLALRAVSGASLRNGQRVHVARNR